MIINTTSTNVDIVMPVVNIFLLIIVKYLRNIKMILSGGAFGGIIV